MPWSVEVGPLRYTPPRRRRDQPAGLTVVVLILLGWAIAALLLAAVVLYAATVVAAWLVGFVVGLVCGDPDLGSRWATAVLDWGRDLVGK